MQSTDKMVYYGNRFEGTINTAVKDLKYRLELEESGEKNNSYWSYLLLAKVPLFQRGTFATPLSTTKFSGRTPRPFLLIKWKESITYPQNRAKYHPSKDN